MVCCSRINMTTTRGLVTALKYLRLPTGTLASDAL